MIKKIKSLMDQGVKLEKTNEEIILSFYNLVEGEQMEVIIVENSEEIKNIDLKEVGKKTKVFEIDDISFFVELLVNEENSCLCNLYGEEILIMSNVSFHKNLKSCIADILMELVRSSIYYDGNLILKNNCKIIL